MCGIAGYIGDRKASPILLNALRKLEYRGYDSVGMAVIDEHQIELKKGKGRVDEVNQRLNFESMAGSIGISQTRWATHGKPSDFNAHPFIDNNHEFALVHNGIIENYLELKEELRRANVTFSSETDSEVLVHLIAQNYFGSLKEAVVKILPKLKGAYAFCVIKKGNEEIVGARKGSPLVVGVGQNENFLSSDVSGIINHTKNVVYLNDFQITSIIKNKIEIYNFEGEPQEFKISKVDWNLEQSQKQGYKHFMLKEIFEQPKIISDSLNVNCLINFIPKRIFVVACGTANYAGLIGKYVIESIAKIPVIVEVASEFRYKDSLLNNEDLVLAISQSGETADTLAAIRLAKERGSKTLGIINVVDSTIAREVDEVIYTAAGPEIGVASTKAFISQLVLLYKLAYHLAGKEFPPVQIGRLVEEVLGQNENIKELAAKYFNYQNFMYIGRHFNFPLALEGALKLKEISYIHAEAYPAGELKHGPIALISEDMPTLAICPRDKVYTKTFSTIEEIKARNGKVITIATIGDETIKKISDDIIYVPEIEESFYPFVITIPLQLFAYHIANLKECDVDKPRNLAKSVTVE